MGFLNTGDRRNARGSAESQYLYRSRMLIRFCGFAVGLALILAALKLDIYRDLPWWIVFLPIVIILGSVFIVLTVAIIGWVRVLILFCYGGIDSDVEAEFRLDTFLRTAKICFLAHGQASLLIGSLGLLLLKLHVWPNLLVIYPMLPLIVLGMAYVFSAVIFKQPEVDSPWYMFLGMSLLSQSIMLCVKLDHMPEDKSLPWALTFAPSWFAYVLLLIYCVVSPLQMLHELESKAKEDSHSASSAGIPYGGAEGRTVASSQREFQSQLHKVAGIACWVIGWGLSQVLLTLRLDVFFKVAWLSVILPSLLGLILLLALVTEHASEYLSSIAELLWGTLVLVNSHVDEHDPLISYDNRPRW